MNILGVHIGHDSGAALVVDGRVVADIAEERMNRVKHSCTLPVRSIQACLEFGGLTISDIDIVAVPTSGPQPQLNFLFDLHGPRVEQRTRAARALELLKRASGRVNLTAPPLYFPKMPLRQQTRIVHVEHHLAHAASAYYTSGSSEKQLIITLDGLGDGIATGIWRGENGKITPLEKYPSKGSLGWFYGNVTEALGWWHGDGEGKTMGLAPYGDPDEVKGILDPYCPKYSNGSLVEAHDFGNVYSWNESGSAEWHLEEADAIGALVARHGREDIAAEAQRVLEDQTAEIIYPWLEREGTRNLTCAGGVFLNVKMNQRIWYSGRIADHHIYPNPGDAGLAVGAALQVHHDENPGSPVTPIHDVYWGPGYSNDEIKGMLVGRNLPLDWVEDPASVGAELLARNEIIGWFQGRMESGPRALGARSILMSPMQPGNKDTINGRVKFREGFRPFCPSLLAEKADDYLVNARDEAYMITSFDAQPARAGNIPAVVHVDGTVRPQTVRREVNEAYWDLIKGFGDITGEYILLNTSFNVMGEPIICHPREAIRAFYDTGIDHLILGNYLLSKESR
jgi:carbamoyltransferase